MVGIGLRVCEFLISVTESQTEEIAWKSAPCRTQLRIVLIFSGFQSAVISAFIPGIQNAVLGDGPWRNYLVERIEFSVINTCVELHGQVFHRIYQVSCVHEHICMAILCAIIQHIGNSEKTACSPVKIVAPENHIFIFHPEIHVVILLRGISMTVSAEHV